MVSEGTFTISGVYSVVRALSEVRSILCHCRAYAVMLEDRLGLFIVTYNRAKSLRRTLEYLLNSPFAGCRITILDNHSADDTPNVCHEYVARFSHLSVVRHRVNIGLSANYLRAVELSRKEYTWILGDDDHFDFNGADDIILKVESGLPDLIIIGAVNQPEWSLGEDTTAQKLVKRRFPYFYISGWITGVIFRTSMFDSECFYKGYKNADNVFPHYYFFVKCLENNVKVYVTKRWICDTREPAGGYGRLASEMACGWLYSARYISNPSIRRIALKQTALGQGHKITYMGIMWLLFRMMVAHTVFKPQTLLDVWFKLFYVMTWDLRLTLLPSLLWPILPSSLVRRLYRAYHFLVTGKRYILEKDYVSALDEGRT